MKFIFTLFVCLVFYLTPTTMYGQIQAKVLDQDGSPLIGATVIEVGNESNGTLTDVDGSFNLNAPPDAKIRVSYIGYNPQIFSSAEYSTGTVQLSTAAFNDLDGVVVTALGVTREKRSLGYSVTELKGDEISTVKTSNPATSLIGKVAGITINQSGGVGSGARILIRGNNSITGRNQALIVVDGVPLNDELRNQGGSVYSSTVSGAGISDINPDDIASISVLKGPNAAALYGSRAANGAILITTKSGSKAKGLGVSFQSNISSELPMFLPDFQNVYGQGSNMELPTDEDNLSGNSWGPKMEGQEAYYFNGETKPYTAQPNNVKDFFRSGYQGINTLAITAGDENYNLRFSYTNNHTNSIIPNSNLRGNNFNLRAFGKLNDKLNLDIKGTYFTRDLNHRVELGTQGLMDNVFYMPRNVKSSDLKKYQQIDNPSIYDPSNGESDYGVLSYTGRGKNTGNPYWILNRDQNTQDRNRFLGFVKLNYEINDYLSLFIRTTGDITNVNTETISAVGNHYEPFGSIEKIKDNFQDRNSDFLLSFDKNVQPKVNIQASVGGNLFKTTSQRTIGRGSRFRVPDLNIINNAQNQEVLDYPESIKKVNSLYGTFSLGYDNYLYFDVTGRNDWSSTLSKNNRSYFYPSFSLSFLAEQFIDPEEQYLDLLKFRASWAQVGNDVNPYQLYQTYSLSNAGYLGLTVLEFPDTKYNPNIKPERVNGLDLGFEAKLYKNRLYSDFAYYNVTTKDMIFRTPVNPATGYQFFLDNIGNVQNKGVEFLLGGLPVDKEDYSWDVSFNFGKNKNKIKELTNGLKSVPLNQTNTGNVRIQADEGGAIGDMYGTTWAKDENGNLLVSKEGIPYASSERIKLGNNQPDWNGGLRSNFRYKNLNFGFLIDGRFGGKIFSATSSALDATGVSKRSLQYREDGIVVNAINNDTGEQNTQTISGQQYWGGVAGMADRYIYDQTNVRMREMSLLYNVDARKIPNVNRLSVGLIGRNLFFFSRKAKDIDPDYVLGTDLNGQGFSINSIPTVRNFGLNLNVNF